MLVTRNSKVDEMIRLAVDSVRQQFYQVVEDIREQHADHVEQLNERISQLQHQLRLANIFVGGGSLEQQVAELEIEHTTKIKTADDLRELAYKMLEAADNVDTDAPFRFRGLFLKNNTLNVRIVYRFK